jgi:RHS repeat-associated protein
VGTLPTQRTFTGQYSHDAGLGSLMYFNARYMSPALGRFVSADTIVPGARNPQAFNRYAFVLNNPLKYSDPSGHCGILSGLLGFFGFISCPADDALDILADPPCGEECESGPFINTGCGDASRCESGPYINTGCNNASPCTSEPYINTGCDGSCDLGILADPIPERGGREIYLSGSGKSGDSSDFDYSDYPEGPAPKPKGSWWIREGKEYKDARSEADRANKGIHRNDPSTQGKQIHEILPVKFGGDPTDKANKIALTPQEHRQYTTWWNRLLRTILGDKE